jgi:hypothetical protein
MRMTPRFLKSIVSIFSDDKSVCNCYNEFQKDSSMAICCDQYPNSIWYCQMRFISVAKVCFRNVLYNRLTQSDIL